MFLPLIGAIVFHSQCDSTKKRGKNNFQKTKVMALSLTLKKNKKEINIFHKEVLKIFASSPKHMRPVFQRSEYSLGVTPLL